MPEQTVITDNHAPDSPVDGHSDAIRCPICGAHLNPRQKYCSNKCRLKAFRIRQVEKIIDRIREELIKEIAR